MEDADKIAENGENTTQVVEQTPVITKPVDETTNGVPAVEDKDTKKTADVSSEEDKRLMLAKIKEELLKAKEESARARDEVERAKKDLEVAKLDTVQSIPTVNSTPAPAADIKVETVVEEVKPVEEVADSTPTTAEGPPVDSVKEVNQEPAAKAEEVQPLPTETPKSESVKVEPEAVATEKVEEIPAEVQAEPLPVPEAAPEAAPVPEAVPVAEMVAPVVEPAVNEEEDNGDAGIEEGEISDAEGDENFEEQSDEGVVIEGDREEGDGEENELDEVANADAAEAKPLDDDEDKRNPQYIPKKGGFYEHDDRTREEGEEAPPEEPVEEEKPKKGMRSEAVDRWGHDMYDENQQGPKNDQELIDLYGYDIRQEEGAPRARRRRRYGRGPNKYDRTWEDEEAYSRPRGRGGASTGQRGAPAGRGAGAERERAGHAERGGNAERGSNVRPRPPQRQDAPKKEDFPPLPDQMKEPADKVQVESGTVFNSSSTNWRDGAGAMGDSGNHRRGGENKANAAISFRRGGRGRTFEERNKSKNVRTRTGDSEHTDESAGNETTVPKDRQKSPRGPEAPPRGSANSRGGRGTPRGAGASGPSPRGGGAPSYRGRRSGDNSSHWEESNIKTSGPSSHQSHARSGDVRNDPPQQQQQHQQRAPFEESRNRGRNTGGSGRFGRSHDDSHHGQVTHGGAMEQMRMDDQQSSRNQDAVRSKRYSSQRQRMTTPPPAAGGGGMPQPPFTGNAAYYQPYNESPPANYVPAPPASMMGPPMVAAQPAPPAFIAPPIYPAAPGPASFAASPYQGYPPAPAAQPVGVPISSPTQENMYGGGIMYYDPGRQQPMHHGGQPPRRPKAAIPIVAPSNEADNYMMAGRRGPHE